MSSRLILIFDADDTLWENNIYFERAFDDFVDFLDHSHLTPVQVRDVLNEIEMVNAKIHGYGSKNFGRNLQQAYSHLAERDIRPDDLDHVFSLAERILEQPLEVIEGVPETLEELSGRHDLALFTKGHPEEQQLKIDRSGLAGFFHRTAIVKEKDAAAYRKLASDNDFPLEKTWMIGNSPKSDINPALEAGLRAVLVPHPHTWVLEHQDVREVTDGRFRRVENFRDLRKYF
jgi:putative hydrolase of the HAD superfamily